MIEKKHAKQGESDSIPRKESKECDILDILYYESQSSKLDYVTEVPKCHQRR